MSIILFLIILSALIIVHELGHFLVARRFGIRVDEFGLGYPPQAKKLFKWKGTLFTINWLPFGGFVKIFGENPSEDATVKADSFQAKNRAIQAAVLFAGVFFNFLFAWILFSVGLMSGLPAPEGLAYEVKNTANTITLVMPGSPADKAGLRSGDVILTINDRKLTPEEASQLIAAASGSVVFNVKRGSEEITRIVSLSRDVLDGRQAVGIAMEMVSKVKLPILKAVYEGLKLTSQLTIETTKGIAGFLSHALIGRANLSEVAGPVGLVSIVGEVSDLGFIHLISLVALISINLAVINLLPIPALDGGRLFFVLIEAIWRRNIPAKVFNTLNAASFALLIFLMILITVHDVRNIF